MGCSLRRCLLLRSEVAAHRKALTREILFVPAAPDQETFRSIGADESSSVVQYAVGSNAHARYVFASKKVPSRPTCTFNST
jgi:hypothetical protein